MSSSPLSPSPMTPTERRAIVTLSGIFGVRMFGLFMILPVFTLYAADEYTGYTATLAGLALGIYGFTQALLQIPFGMLSDRVGRRPVIVAGLLVFVLGSVVAATSDSILGVIAGRALQGAGAIAAATMALLADLTREEHRTRAMATFGASIGMVFMLALMTGPIIAHLAGLSGLFWVTAALGLVGIGALYLAVPTPEAASFHRDTEATPGQFLSVLRDGQLLRLDLGIFVLHLTLMASWVAIPLSLRDAGLVAEHHWWAYLLVMTLAILIMVPFVILAEKYQRTKPVFLGAILALGLCQLGLLGYHGHLILITALMVVFFSAFNVLEANLPSLVSRAAPPDKKGTALGVYSTAQFLGAFVGALAGGWLFDNHGGAPAVFGFCSAMAGAWFLFAVTMRAPGTLRNHLLKVTVTTEEEAAALSARLLREPGVAEAVVVAGDGVAYLKVDPKRYAREEPAGS
uniref:Predicted arabinose efflux permease, MFS family n=1 Tax=Candidatus Kentrum sp. DK TaxID=2126562 RepID=A0A450S8J4_9GAMM|nr:MAG: Predicted arabinose efflux permease, MFS family [Candidatus Kentron sp. DK]